MNWQDEAKHLPPPSQQEMDDWADGIVYHELSDGTLLRYDPEKGWVP